MHTFQHGILRLPQLLDRSVVNAYLGRIHCAHLYASRRLITHTDIGPASAAGRLGLVIRGWTTRLASVQLGFFLFACVADRINPGANAPKTWR